MSFLGSIKKIFKKKENNMSEQTMPEHKPQPKRKHKLEIQVFEADYEKADINNGQPQWRPVRSDPALDGGRPTIIEVADKAEFIELQKQYAMCDQRIKVIREIDPFVDEPTSNKAPTIPPKNQAIPVQSTSSYVDPMPSAQTTVIKTPVAATSPLPVSIEKTVKPKPKIVTIGDIEVKYDGDKVYQKQWMKLTPTEASNFRVVNDSNNKIFNLSGKHIEAKRWMLVEEKASTSEDDAVENLIEG